MRLFEGTNIQITCEGERHLGAVIGKKDFKEKYVASKIEKWIDDIKELAKIGIDEPQAALSGYTKSLCHRWTFVQRTIPNIKHLFAPLEECLREVFIPSVLGRKVSELERKILSLPVRFGGLGIANPLECADREYDASCIITENLSSLIFQQQQDLAFYNTEETIQRIKNLPTQ